MWDDLKNSKIGSPPEANIHRFNFYQTSLLRTLSHNLGLRRMGTSFLKYGLKMIRIFPSSVCLCVHSNNSQMLRLELERFDRNERQAMKKNCTCRSCVGSVDDGNRGWSMFMNIFYVCPNCYKRECPHAENCSKPCGGRY